MGIEHVEDVRRLPRVELDPERVDQHQTVDAGAGLDGDLGSEPAAEGKPHEGEALVRQSLDDLEVEVHEVVDGLEVCGAGRIAEARM
jgi:hypothetical protein